MTAKKKDLSHDRISKAKSDLSVGVIQYNKELDRLLMNLTDGFAKLKKYSSSFGSQRELLARSRMTERVMNSCMKMISGNKLQLWMINDRDLEDDNK